MALSCDDRRYKVRVTRKGKDIRAAQRLRYTAFMGGDAPAGLDHDVYDSVCHHVLIEDTGTGRLVCCFRMLPLTDGRDIIRSYSAQYYELSSLKKYKGPMVEMGRFCIHPDEHHPDILRVAWGAMARFVDDNGIELLFGCSSFKGTDAEDYLDAFAMLKECHLAPRRWLPKVKAPSVFRFAQKLRRRKPDVKQAMLRMPPLLRTYLLMGGWVSDHAVVDRQMNTLHVFTGVEINAIPAARKRLLRAVA